MRKPTELTENQVVSLKSKKEIKRFVKLLDKKGITADSGRKWSKIYLKKDECINVASGVYAGLEWYEERGYEIIPASEFLEPDRVMEIERRLDKIEKWIADHTEVTLTSEPTPSGEVDFKVGQKYIGFNGLVVFMTKDIDPLRFEGFVIKINGIYELGYSSPKWAKSTFLPYNEPITL